MQVLDLWREGLCERVCGPDPRLLHEGDAESDLPGRRCLFQDTTRPFEGLLLPHQRPSLQARAMTVFGAGCLVCIPL